jgi:hypothetical protein
MNLELAILTELESAHPRMLKRSVLEAELRLQTEDFTLTTFERALVALEKKGQIRLYPGEDITRVAITDEGLNRVAATR